MAAFFEQLECVQPIRSRVKTIKRFKLKTNDRNNFWMKVDHYDKSHIVELGTKPHGMTGTINLTSFAHLNLLSLGNPEKILHCGKF